MDAITKCKKSVLRHVATNASAASFATASASASAASRSASASAIVAGDHS